MAEIFISHAVSDKILAEHLVNFLTEAIGVPADSIFCSSVEGYGVPLTKDFNLYIKDKIKHPKLVILLMTETYMERPFCLMELGAAWSLSHDALPIIVPPIEFGTVVKTLGLTQGWNIKQESGLNDIRSVIKKAGIQLEPRSDHTWDKKRKQWIAKLPTVLKKLPKASSVSIEKYNLALEEISKQNEKYTHLESEYSDTLDLVEELKEAKDREEVSEIIKKSSGNGLEAEYKRLIENIKEKRPSTSLPFFWNMMLDRHGEALPIDPYDDEARFYAEKLVQRKYARWAEDGRTLLYSWDKKMKRLDQAAQELENFLSSEDAEGFVRDREAGGFSVELDDLEFWEENFD